MSDALFATQADYEVPLLRLLAELPDGKGRSRDVVALFWDHYQHRIPARHRESLASKSDVKRWDNIVRWARQALVKHGFADASARGVWRITPAGRDWLVDNPHATRLPPVSRAKPSPNDTPLDVQGQTNDQVGSAKEAPTHAAHPAKVLAAIPVTVTIADRQVVLARDQVLAAARAALANGIPAEASNYLFWAVEVDEQLVGAKWLLGLVTGIPRGTFDSTRARSVFERLGLNVRRIDSPPVPTARPVTRTVRAADERRAPPPTASTWSSVTVTPITGPHAILDAQIRAVRDFLNGRASRPSDEKLCDWVHFCYTFELYREADALFQLVDPAQVEHWQYARSKRLAAICRMKITGRA